MHVAVGPSHDDLEHVMQSGELDVVRHMEPPPDGWLAPHERDLELAGVQVLSERLLPSGSDHGDMECMGVMGVNAVQHGSHFFLNSTPTEVHSATGGRNMNRQSSQRMHAVMLCAVMLFSTKAWATSNHEYGADEYDTVASGISPDGKYAITAHGEGELGYDHFHIYLTNAVTGKKIGPLEEIKGVLDTGADAYAAKWSNDSQEVVIVYRVDRHAPLQAVFYHVAKGRAFPIKGPVDLKDEDPLVSYWGASGSNAQPSPKVFGQSIK